MIKKIYILLAVLLTSSICYSQTTATDFTVNDCNGTSRHLFAELDAGKTVVMVMVHPCVSCIGPAKSALSVVNGYTSSNPGKVIYYLTDDVGNTNCSTLSTWASTNGISGVPVLSSTSITQLDYGVSAMPKTVVVSGLDHKIYFVQDNSLNTTNLKAAIDQALLNTASSELILEPGSVEFFPNPMGSQNAYVSYQLNKSSMVSYSIYNVLGAKIIAVPAQLKQQGKQSEEIRAVSEMVNGIYFLQLKTESGMQLIRFVVQR